MTSNCRISPWIRTKRLDKPYDIDFYYNKAWLPRDCSQYGGGIEEARSLCSLRSLSARVRHGILYRHPSFMVLQRML